MKKNDISTGVGLLLGFIAIVFGMTWSDGSFNIGRLMLFWDPPSIFITVFGSFFALIISMPDKVIKRMPQTLRNAFLKKQMEPDALILKFSELSKKARKNGLLSLENDIETIEDQFLKTGAQMIVDGIEPQIIKEILELDIDEMLSRHQEGIAAFKTWAALAPAFGMIGTLIGLIQMLAKLEDAKSLGAGMAVALVTSFYGAVMANFIFTPLAQKLETKSIEESKRREMMIEGILGIQSGTNPRILEDKLKTYLSPEEKILFINNVQVNNIVDTNE